MKTPTTGGMDALSGLSSKQIYDYLEPFGQKSDSLEEQLKMAEALRGWQPSTPSYGAMAGIGNGLATILNAYTGTRDAKNVRDQQAALYERERTSALPVAQQMQALADLLRGGSPQPPQQGLQVDPYAPPRTSFGL